MRSSTITHTVRGLVAVGVLCLAPLTWSQTPSGTVFDETVPPGSNFDKANFRLWLPDIAGPLRAVIVLVPGSNGDGRPEAADPIWQTFAAKHHLALLACQFTDKPHDQGFIEDYVNVSKGSGQALLQALASLAARAKHPELQVSPLLLWGMSAGGQFNYEFVAWKPERVVAFVVNKGGIYYTALAPRAARNVPGLLFIGEKDLWSRNDTIKGLFAVNRRAGALWALAEEPGVAHVVGRSRDVAIPFFEETLERRLDTNAAGDLKAIAESDGFIGDLATWTFKPAAGTKPNAGPTVWLPGERTALAWKGMGMK